MHVRNDPKLSYFINENYFRSSASGIRGTSAFLKYSNSLRNRARISSMTGEGDFPDQRSRSGKSRKIPAMFGTNFRVKRATFSPTRWKAFVLRQTRFYSFSARWKASMIFAGGAVLFWRFFVCLLVNREIMVDSLIFFCIDYNFVWKQFSRSI